MDTTERTPVSLYARVSSDRQDVDPPAQPSSGLSATTQARMTMSSRASLSTRPKAIKSLTDLSSAG